MAVKIKLKRVGKIHAPQYRIVVADSRTARNGRAIEEIGIYQPLDNPSLIKLDSDRAQYWLGVGAQPTEAVMAILKVTGDWQKFKGLPGAEGTLEVAEVKPNKIIAFEAAVKAAADEPKTKPKPKLEKVVEDVVEKAEEAAEKVAEVVEDVVEKAAEAVKDAVEDIVEKVEEAVHGDKADEAPAAEAAAAGESAEEAKA
ncbi:MAG: 30S ribosomal protein S16 [Actinomycetota bacterium]|nr:30S ribosomal protein S16 [Actinomycetota bacterium]